MHKTDQNGSGGISIRAVHWAMIVCAVVIALLLVFSTYQTSSVFSSFSRETGNYIVRQKAAHDLMEASDYLTEMVQRFTQEGDTVYLDNYFEEAFVSKRREAAILTMSDNKAEESLIQHLQEAMNESQSLMYREYYAMRLVIEARDIRDYPEPLRAVELTEADAFLSAEEKIDLAQKMVMGSEYYAGKSVIRTKLKTNLEMLDQMMSSARQSSSALMMKDLTLARTVIAVLTLVLILLIWLTSRLITVPLIGAARSVRKKEPIRPAGSKEFRQLAESYNGMYDSLHQERKE